MSGRRPYLTTARRVEARRSLAKTSSTLAVDATAHLDRVPASPDDYWHDLRRGRRWIWGGLTRFIERCNEIGAPLDVVLAAIDAMKWFARDLYGVTPTPTPQHA